MDAASLSLCASSNRPANSAETAAWTCADSDGSRAPTLNIRRKPKACAKAGVSPCKGLAASSSCITARLSAKMIFAFGRERRTNTRPVIVAVKSMPTKTPSSCVAASWSFLSAACCSGVSGVVEAALMMSIR